MFATDVLPVVVFALTVGAATVMYYFRGSDKKRTIPGIERTDPRDGNFPDIGAAGSLHEFLMNLHKKHGPITSFWFGPKYTVSIASPELFKEHMGPFDRPPEIYTLFKPMFGECSITLANKEDGKGRRSMYDHCFGHQTLNHFYAAFNEIANELVMKLSAMPKDENHSLSRHCLAITIKAIMRTSFGDYFKDDANISKFRHSYEICMNEMGRRLSDGLPQEGSERDKKFKEGLHFMKNVVRDVIEKRKANPTVGHQVFIDVLIENDLPERQVLDDCITFIVAGFHTSGYVLTWALYYLANHQECQEKLCRQIEEIVGRGEVDNSHLDGLTYLRQVINESLRVSVLGSYASRFQDNDSKLGGHVIPAGTPVIHALGVVLQDDDLWPQPKEFDPERFSRESFTKRHKAAFKPFGFAGTRVCPGQHFSYAEVSVFLVILCRAFKFNLVPGQKVEQKYTLVTSPKEEIWVTLEKRN